ncbi:MAG: HEAT repeat domain-containing protein [Candidatus Lernaella stagnicola]|nr:HEAT repeat domain-containing protein [Candidatus Lernaella stagnicola]
MFAIVVGCSCGPPAVAKDVTRDGIPDRRNLACASMLEVYAAQNNFTGENLFSQNLADAPPALKYQCRWLLETRSSGAYAVIFTKSKNPQWKDLEKHTDPQDIIDNLAFWQRTFLADGSWPKGDTQPLRARLQSPDADVRLFAAETLGAVGDTATAPALIQRLRQDTDAAVRFKAAWALGRMQYTAAAPALTAALDDADFDVVRQAAVSLGHVGDPQALPALWRHLRVPSSFVQHSIIAALEEMARRDRKRLAASYRKLNDKEKTAVKKVLTLRGGASLFTAIGEPIPKPPPPEDAKAEARKETTTRRLVELLGHRDREVTKEAVSSLALHPSPEAAEALVELYPKCDPDTRAMIITTLGIIASPKGKPVLLAALKEKDTEFLRRALVSLALVGSSADAPTVAPFLKHADAAVREKAVIAMGTFQASDPALTEATHDRAERVQYWAVWALGRSGDPTAAASIKPKLETNLGYWKIVAGRALANVNGTARPDPKQTKDWLWFLWSLGQKDTLVARHKMFHLGTPDTDENTRLGQ